MRRVIIEASKRWTGLWPRVLKNISYAGTRKPRLHEAVVLETKKGNILNDGAKVETVNQVTKTYDVRIW